jgi:hypothetical protein
VPSLCRVVVAVAVLGWGGKVKAGDGAHGMIPVTTELNTLPINQCDGDCDPELEAGTISVRYTRSIHGFARPSTHPHSPSHSLVLVLVLVFIHPNQLTPCHSLTLVLISARVSCISRIRLHVNHGHPLSTPTRSSMLLDFLYPVVARFPLSPPPPLLHSPLGWGGIRALCSASASRW